MASRRVGLQTPRPRAAADTLREYLQIFRAVVLNGPRQAGKSTLAAQVIDNFVSLDDADQRRAATDNPKLFSDAGTGPDSATQPPSTALHARGAGAWRRSASRIRRGGFGRARESTA